MDEKKRERYGGERFSRDERKEKQFGGGKGQKSQKINRGGKANRMKGGGMNMEGKKRGICL